MRPRKYHVTLTEEEHSDLLELVKKGKTQAYRITHAQVLLKLDENFNEKPWTTDEISKAYNINPRTVSCIGRRFVEGVYITVKMYPCSGGTDTGSPGL